MTASAASSWGSPTIIRSPGASPRRSPAQGAELAFTYQGEALGKRVDAAGREPRLRRSCCPATSRTSPRSTTLFDGLQARLGRARLPRPLHRLFRPQRAEGPLRRHHARQLSAHDDDLGLFLHRGRQARGGADAERRRAADADLRRLDPRHAELQRDGRRQGGAGGERALSRRRFRPQRHSRQRHLGRADPHAGRRRHRRRALHVQLPARPFAAAPHRDDRRGRRRRRSICCRDLVRRA